MVEGGEAEVLPPRTAFGAATAGPGNRAGDTIAGSKSDVARYSGDDSGEFVTQDERKRHLRMPATDQLQIGSARERRFDLYDHLSVVRSGLGKLTEDDVSRPFADQSAHRREGTTHDTIRPMKRILLFASCFLLAATLEASPAGTTATSRPRPTPRAKKAIVLQNVVVQSIEPQEVSPGELVTILGTGFDQGTAILLGSASPSVVEQTAGKIVFRAPAVDPQHAEWTEVPLYLVTPGFPVTNTNVKLKIRPQDRKGGSGMKKATPPADIALEQSVSVSAGQSPSLLFELNDGNGVDISLRCTGAEVEMNLEGGDPAVTSIFATWSGGFEKRMFRKELLGPASAGPKKGHVRVTLATDSRAEVPCHVRISRLAAPPAMTSIKPVGESSPAK